MHHQGEVISHQGEVLGFFEYDDRTGTCLTKIWPTREEMLAHWRGGHTASCTCGQPAVDVLLFEANYAPGSHWPGKACLGCHAIVGGIEWSELDDPWPKDGHPFGVVVDEDSPPAKFPSV